MADPLSREDFLREVDQVLAAGVTRPQQPIDNASVSPREFFARFARPDVPLDLDTGAPLSTRLNAAFAPDDNTRQALLQNAFENATVEPLRTTERAGRSAAVPGSTHYIVRNYRDPQTGQVKDLLVDEANTSLRDLVDLGPAGLEMAGAIAALTLGGPLTAGLAGGRALLAQAALAGAGSQLAGASADAATRLQAGQPVQPGEIMARRTVSGLAGGAVDMGMGVPILAAKRALKAGVSIESGPLPAWLSTRPARESAAARARLGASSGTPIPASFAEQTGLAGTARLQAFLEGATISGGPLRGLKERRALALAANERSIVGATTPLPDKDTLGGQAVRALRAVGQDRERLTMQAREDALTGAIGLLDQAIDAETGLASRVVLDREAGNAVQQFMLLKKDALDAEAERLAGEVNRLVGDKPFVATTQLKERAEKALTAAYAKPGEVDKLLESTPASLRPVIRDIQDLPDQVTLDDIRRLRRSVNRQISQGQILGDTDEGVLKQLSAALTESISTEAKKLPADAADALARFNKFYAEGIAQFEVKGITELLADPTQRKLGPSTIFDQAAKNADQYFRVKEALTQPLTLDGAPIGPVATGDITWNLFKKAMLDEMLSASRTGSRQLVDAKRFLGQLHNLKATVRADLLGQGADTVNTALARLEGLQNPKLDADEVLEALRRGGDTGARDIEALALREQAVNAFYRDRIVRRFVKGEEGAESIEPGEFIDRYLETATDKEEVKRVLGHIEMVDPGLAITIRQKTIENLFTQARAAGGSAADIEKLSKLVASDEQQARLRVVLGDTVLGRLNDYLLEGRSSQSIGRSAARAAGGIAGGVAASRAITFQWGKLMPQQLAYWLTGYALANPRSYRMAFKGPQAAPGNVLKTLIATDDFLASAAAEFGPDFGTVMQVFEQAAEREGGGPTREEFLKQVDATVPQ